MHVILAPSVLSADFIHLGDDLKSLADSKAEWIHYDVMDGHFVPNISFGQDILRQVRGASAQYIDVHLMISDPQRYVAEFASCGADSITFHADAYAPGDPRIQETIDIIRSAGCKVGMTVRPSVGTDVITPWLPQLDLVLVMSVEPGFGGQKFMPAALDVIRYYKELRVRDQLNYLIEVDGGINDQTITDVVEAGVDVVVAGSYVFRHGIQEGIETLWNKSSSI